MLEKLRTKLPQLRKARINAYDAAMDAAAAMASSTARHAVTAEDEVKGLTLAELDHFVHMTAARGAGNTTTFYVRVKAGRPVMLWTAHESEIEGGEHHE